MDINDWCDEPKLPNHTAGLFQELGAETTADFQYLNISDLRVEEIIEEGKLKKVQAGKLRKSFLALTATAASVSADPPAKRLTKTPHRIHHHQY